jgi:hypothetical protein
MAGMDLINYLNKHFLTRDQVLAASRIDGARLDELAARGAVPSPSYTLRLQIACNSFFGPHEETCGVDYYACGMPAWIGAVEAGAEPFAYFAQRYRDALAALPLRAEDAKLNAGLSDHLQNEWTHFLSGTYGLCTRSGLPEDIAAKELAICVVRELTDDGRTLNEADLARLRAAVDMLDRASSAFAPHERERSSRRRYVEAMRLRYGWPALN